MKKYSFEKLRKAIKEIQKEEAKILRKILQSDTTEKEKINRILNIFSKNE
jgi:hypothetical protein